MRAPPGLSLGEEQPPPISPTQGSMQMQEPVKMPLSPDRLLPGESWAPLPAAPSDDAGAMPREYFPSEAPGAGLTGRKPRGNKKKSMFISDPGGCVVPWQVLQADRDERQAMADVAARLLSESSTLSEGPDSKPSNESGLPEPGSSDGLGALISNTAFVGDCQNMFQQGVPWPPSSSSSDPPPADIPIGPQRRRKGTPNRDKFQTWSGPRTLLENIDETTEMQTGPPLSGGPPDMPVPPGLPSPAPPGLSSHVPGAPGVPSGIQGSSAGETSGMHPLIAEKLRAIASMKNAVSL